MNTGKEMRTGQNMINKFFFAMMFACLLSMAGQTACFASTVVLQWDPNTDTNLAGYKIYYQADSSTQPFHGTGATQGATPVDIHNQTTATISGLDPAHPYYFAVTAYNTAGVESVYSNIVSVPELVSPTVSLSYPANNASVSGTVSVTASASDNVGVTKVEFYVNGALQATDTSTPYLYSWNTTSLAAGSYTLMAKAYDAAGNIGQSANVTVNVVNDSTAPTVSVTAPANNAIVSGTATITASASDNVGVTKVEFYENGVLLSATNVSPYSYSWNTATAANGAYTLNAKAYDAAGNVGLTSNVMVTVSNTYTVSASAGSGGTISPAGNSVVNYGANQTFSITTASGYQVAGVTVDGSSVGAVTSYTFSNVTANHTIAATFASSTYTLTYSAGVNGTINGSTPQTVNSGGNGTLVTAVANTGYHFVSWSDGVTTAARTDSNVTANHSVTASFAVNTYTLTYTAGVNGTINGSTPQSVNSGGSGTLVTAVANTGYHFVSWSNGVTTAARTDSNVTANISVTATFAINNTSQLNVSITSPVANATVKGTVSVKAAATDSVKISKVEFYLNGVLKRTDTSSPYSYSWITTSSADGIYTLTAKAYDPAGNISSSTIAVSVKNDTTAPKVSISSPATNATVSGIKTVTATASDNIGVKKVEFYVNGELQVTDTASPWNFSWNTTPLTNGAYTISAKAYDASGNVGQSSTTSVTVSN